MTDSSEVSSADPNPTTPNHDLPSDPLLEPGSFIDADQNGPNSLPAYSAADATPVRPSWLPEGWTMSFKVRSSGATAGSIDRYYFEPNSELRFRSRKEVDYYLETGTKRKKSDASADVQASERSAAKKKKSRSGSKKSHPTPPSPLKFDFKNIPEMTTWKLKDGSNDHWVPFIDGKMVPKSSREEWEAVFQSHLSVASGHM